MEYMRLQESTTDPYAYTETHEASPYPSILSPKDKF
jgi:hypothetical protein